MLGLGLVLTLAIAYQEPEDVLWRTDVAAATVEARETDRPLVLVFR